MVKKDTRDTIGMESAQVIGVTNVTSLIATHTRSQGMRQRNTMAMERDYQTTRLYIYTSVQDWMQRGSTPLPEPNPTSQKRFAYVEIFSYVCRNFQNTMIAHFLNQTQRDFSSRLLRTIVRAYLLSLMTLAITGWLFVVYNLILVGV